MAGRKLQNCLAALVTSVAVVGPACAQEQRQEFRIEAQPLGEALKSASRQSGREILFSADMVEGRRAPRLAGIFTAEEAVRALLAGTGFTATVRGGAIVIQGRSEPSGEIADRPAESDEITVTGTRIGGRASVSPVIVRTQRELTDAGFTNLGDVIRSIPQNYSGGQNPTVAGGGNQGAANQNTNSSSTLNLRGLGPDATLTLVNGHRMPYDAVFQGVDISAIPLAAIDRIEIVTDGSSAIYGSDAVAGVANIILKRSFDGVAVSARGGLSTDGGNTQQQYGLVGGADWKSGGFIATLDYSRSSQILAKDRDFTQTLDPSATLVPRLKQYSAIASGYQRIGDAARFEIDGTYSHRDSWTQLPSTNIASYLDNGATSQPEVTSFSVSPSLKIAVAPNWEFYVSGTYGQSRTHVQTTLFASGSPYFYSLVDYNNTLKSVESGANGSVATLPGGALKIAFGGGYRSNTLDAFTRSINGTTVRVSSDYTRSRDSAYGFAEISAPIVGPENARPLIYRLTLNGAVRHEDYPGIGAVTTPKLGMLYAPVAGLDLKASWGRSFKAPTLYQQFQYKSVSLRPVTAYGAGTFPAGSTVLQMAGGNGDFLEPERAETLTLSAAYRPRFLPGAHIELSYFKVRYRDRVIQPITSSLGLFSNPIYAHLITFSPTSEQIAAALANAPAGLSNQSGAPYDPSKVVAIVDNRQRNSASQEIEGIDLSGRYEFATGAKGKLTVLGDASYLRSRQILVAGQASVDLAGRIFNPPHWRARGGVSWESGGLTATSYVNFIGGTQDRRISPVAKVASFTTLDAALTYRVHEDGSPLDGLEISLSAMNLLNADPDRIRQSIAIDPPYDSTNYSPVGRFVSLSIRKQW